MLPPQAALKMDAAESYVEQQQKEKEMVEAENAAMDARLFSNNCTSQLPYSKPASP